MKYGASSASARCPRYKRREGENGVPDGRFPPSRMPQCYEIGALHMDKLSVKLIKIPKNLFVPSGYSKFKIQK